MKPTEPAPWRPGARQISRALATGTIAIAMLGLAGHALGAPLLYALSRNFQAMSPLTATGLSLTAMGLLMAMAGRGRGLAAGGLLIGGATLLSHILVGHDAVNPALAGMLGVDGAGVGRTSVGTAVALLLLSLATCLYGRGWQRLVDGCAALAFLISLLAIASYGYSSADLYALPFFRTMALNTALAILLLSCATVLSQTQAGWGATIAAPGEAGRATRRQLLFLACPPLIGWGLVQIANAGYLHLGSAMALLVVFTIAPLLWLVLRDGRALAELARERSARAEAEAEHVEALQARHALQEKSQARLLLAQQAALESKDRYRLLFDSIDAGFCVVEMTYDDDGRPTNCRFIEVNSAFETHTGLSGAAGQWMRDLVPDYEQQRFDLFGEVARTGKAARFESPGRAYDDRCYEVHAFRVDEASQAHVGILFNDITERRRAEDALRQINATLEQRVVTEVATREEAQAALRQSQKMEALGQLTGGVAHDFNNLLTPIVGTLDMLGRRGGLSERETRLLDGAMQSADRAKTLVQRLLAFARRQPLQPGPVDVRALIAGMAELVAGSTGPQIHVLVETPPDLPPAQADAHQLEMAILNLCVNARDAMADGGTLTIAAHQQWPGEALGLPDRAHIRLSVADTGTGMTAETLKRAVEPFYSTKGVGKGTGLGLSMVHGLAAQLHGTLDIRSEVGMGTRIDLWLPISQQVQTLVPETAAAPVGGRARGRMLVVDDEAAVRNTTADMLHELGYDVVEMGSARDALALLLGDEHFDIVVTDHLMPGMTGVDLAMALRQVRPRLPVLLVSGYADVEALAPDIPLLAKPFRQDDLQRALARLPRAA